MPPARPVSPHSSTPVTRRRRVRFAVLLIAALPVCGSWAQVEPERGVFGVTVAISAEGWLRPTIRAAHIVQVQPGMPAHRAGIASGDEVLELDGRRIPGAAAADLAPLAQGKRIGETLSVLLRRPGGDSYRAVLTADRPLK